MRLKLTNKCIKCNSYNKSIKSTDKEKLIKVINTQQTSTYWFPNEGDLESNQILLEISRILQMSLHATLIRPQSSVKLLYQGWAHAPDW